MEYTRNRQTPKNYGGSYTPPDESIGQEPEQLGAMCMEEETAAVNAEYDRLLGNVETSGME